MYFRTAVLEGFLYVLGARVTAAPIRAPQRQKADPSTDQWVYIADIPSSDPGVISSFGCVTYNNRIYIYGA